MKRSQTIPLAIEVGPAKRSKNAARSRLSKSSRPFRQGPKAGSQLVNLSRQPGFPAKMLMKHKYADAFLLDNTGTLGKGFVACNGMFLPIAGGHQPSYFDTMATVYNHYTVIGSVIRCKFMTNTNSAVPDIVAVQQNDDATFTPTTISTVIEQPNAISGVVPYGIGAQPTVLTMKYSAKGTFGSGVLSNDNLQGTSAANPTELTYWLIAHQASDAASRVATTVSFEVEYLAVWDELKDIAQS